MQATRRTLLALPFLVVGVLGCGGGDDRFDTAAVTGKVVHDGKPVTGGSLTFLPKGEGKPASAKIADDGTFVVGTYEEDDGAVVGEHTVSYSSPEIVSSGDGDDEESHDAPAPAPFEGLAVKETKVTVKSGGTELTIELVKP